MPSYKSYDGDWKPVNKPVKITIEDKPVVIKKEEVSLDLNKDGVVDTKDASIASKVFTEVKRKKYSRKKKNK